MGLRSFCVPTPKGMSEKMMSGEAKLPSTFQCLLETLFPLSSSGRDMSQLQEERLNSKSKDTWSRLWKFSLSSGGRFPDAVTSFQAWQQLTRSCIAQKVALGKRVSFLSLYYDCFPASGEKKFTPKYCTTSSSHQQSTFGNNALVKCNVRHFNRCVVFLYKKIKMCIGTTFTSTSLQNDP